jgi:4-hydroxybenzoate polyprenyltransferase
MAGLSKRALSACGICSFNGYVWIYAVSYSMHLHNPNIRLSDVRIPQTITVIVTTLFWFMLLRIADEHKNYEDDCQFRPNLPVQRGLVKLKELRYIGMFLGLTTIGLSIWVDWRLLGTLAIAGIWFTLMSLKFGVSKWLKAQPTIYLFSHMMLLPLIDLYATSVEWLPRGGAFSFGILLYMISSFCDGTVVEVGRKVHAPENEEYGVDIYTQIWRAKPAMIVWMFCKTISGTTTILAGFQVQIAWEIMCVLSPLYLLSAYSAIRFAKNPTPKNAKVFTILPAFG